MGKDQKKKTYLLTRASTAIPNWVGTPLSLVSHTVFFVGIFALYIFGITIDQILLVLTTLVSLEAIYLAIFIQMTVNRNTASLQAVEEDLDDIQEDVKGLEEDIEEIQEEEAQDEIDNQTTRQSLEKIQTGLQKLLQDIENLKKSSATHS